MFDSINISQQILSIVYYYINKDQANLLFIPKTRGKKEASSNTKHLKCVTRENNIEVPTIDKQSRKKALEYSPWLLSGITKESLKLNTDTAGCKQTVTAVKHLLQEVSKVQTFQLQQI